MEVPKPKTGDTPNNTLKNSTPTSAAQTNPANSAANLKNNTTPKPEPARTSIPPRVTGPLGEKNPYQYWSDNTTAKGKQKPAPDLTKPVESREDYRQYLERFNSSSLILERSNRIVDAGTLRTLGLAVELNNYPQIKAMLKQRYQVDLASPPSTFSYDKYLEIVEFLRVTLFGNIGTEAGYEEIGYRIVQNYFAGSAGQIMKMMANVIGAHNGAKQFIKSISRALPWGKHELEEIRPGYARYHKSLVGGPPPIMLGMIRAIIEAAGAKIIRSGYTVLSESKDDIIYEVEWR